MLELFKDQDMMYKIKKLALPSIIENALQTVVMYADTAMVGAIGASASAAVGLTISVNWLVNSPMTAFGIGLLAFISRSIGARNEEDAKIAGIQAIYLCLGLGISLGIITLLITPYLPMWLCSDEAIYKDASLYFGAICTPMLFRASSLVFGSVLRATGDTKTPMVVNVVMNIINIILNYFLIGGSHLIYIGNLKFSLYGASLGVLGAGIASAIAYIIGGTLMFMAYRNSSISYRGHNLRINQRVMKACVHVGFPITLERLAHCFGQVIFTAMVARLGTIAIAAHCIALTAEEAFYIPGYGMQAAASTLCGMAVGEKDEKKLMRTSRAIATLAFMAMSLMGIILFIVAKPMMMIFTPDAAVVELGASVLRIVAISEPLFAIAIILEGVFNGVGDTKVPFYISAFTMWGVRIITTFICVFIFKLGLNAVWICMVLDNATKCLAFSLRYHGTHWKKKLLLTDTKA